MKLQRILPVLLFALSLGLLASSAASAQTFGNPVSEGDVVSIAKLMSEPEDFQDKAVRVEGVIGSVCTAMGCWMELHSLDESETASVRVQAEHGQMVFPLSAIGGTARVEGSLSLVPMKRDSWIDWQSHLAKDRGEEFDASTVGDGPFQRVELKPAGVEIKGKS